jgi:outer membrane protein OmpA-like peptidoglycan-associated protein
MKKIFMLIVVMMLISFISVVQAEARAGGSPASNECSVTSTGPRAGGLSPLMVDDRIIDCPCPPYCPPAVAEPAPPPVAVKRVVPPPPAPRPVVIERGRQTLDVKFDFDKSTIKAGDYNDIDDLSQVMKDYPDLKVVVEGHTDSIGSDAYNKTLSQERADAVKKYMVEKNGINANRIKAIGFGEERPIASNDTEEGRSQNRRVEAVVDYIVEN